MPTWPTFRPRVSEPALHWAIWSPRGVEAIPLCQAVGRKAWTGPASRWPLQGIAPGTVARRVLGCSGHNTAKLLLLKCGQDVRPIKLLELRTSRHPDYRRTRGNQVFNQLSLFSQGWQQDFPRRNPCAS